MFITVTEFDLNIVLWIQENLRSDFLTLIFSHITSIGSVLLALMAACLILKGNDYQRFIGIVSVLSACIEVSIVNGFLKNIIARQRPFIVSDEVVPLVTILSEYSFPSGHTALAFAIALVFYRLLPKKYGIVTILIAVLVGFSRVYLGVHYPSDVFGGFLIAFITSRLAECIVVKFRGSLS